MPRMGLGVWKLPAAQTAATVTTALKVGYRHIDTAAIYGNEKEVGEAIKQSDLPRKTLFVASKLWTDDHSAAKAVPAFEASLTRLDIGYIDLFLSHFPVQGKRVETWKALQEVMASGKCRALGVSNYTVRHLEELINRTGIRPAVNQVEFHPFLYQKELLSFCESNGIVLEAYSPLMHGHRHDHAVLQSVAKSSGKTVAQVLIRWCLQHGLAVIPKTSRKERLVENLAVFDFHLGEAEMARLDALNDGFRTCWDPTKTP